MEYYKNTEEGRMNWQSDIARYVKQGIEEGSQKTRREDVEILLRKKRLTADEIAEDFNIPISEVLKIAESIF